ncbi:hypothetical protein [Spiroplasma endosymbiont of Polydrusus pterygomalis]|uniref:hypothetical protein n=1 Tax=Spiroplasma endosymbiont of Polydrusus pterygomalis TaxID=3139327 RepID=UPI003CCA7E8C
MPPAKKPTSKNATKEKWLFIKSQTVIDSTPAMKRSIDRSVGDVYTKTAADYRAKDGTAITTAITAERLIAERLGKTVNQRKAIETKNSKKSMEKVITVGEAKAPDKKQQGIKLYQKKVITKNK